ncbi:hypothetical protein JCM8547_006697 [Rhodosporidiobolus lusitaniae]
MPLPRSEYQHRSRPVHRASPAADSDSAQLPSSGLKDQATQTEIKEGRKGKNIVLVFDGTTNTFSGETTNVVALAKLLSIDPDKQAVYYQTGIGTAAPSVAHHPILRSVLGQPVVHGMRKLSHATGQLYDAAVAVSLDDHIMKGYEFLMNHYQPGDKIFLFGFSRDAYTARALAGMLEVVELLPPGNADLVPLAYTKYKALTESIVTYALSGREITYEKIRAERKHTAFVLPLSRKFEISFMGVCDTVSSVGALVERTLPFVARLDFIRHFCHALALDENRVDYLPELVHDVGGEREAEWHASLADTSLRWMLKKALQHGLLFDRYRWLLKAFWHHEDAPFEHLSNPELQDFLDNVIKPKSRDDWLVAVIIWCASLPSVLHRASNSPRNDAMALKSCKPRELLMALFWHARRLFSAKLEFDSPLSPHLSLPGTRQLVSPLADDDNNDSSPCMPLFHSSVKQRMHAENLEGEPNGLYCPAATINGQKITLENVDDLVEWVD